MAWNPSTEVAVARDAAKALGADQVIVIYLKLEQGQIGMATYGKTKKLCDETKILGDEAYKAVYATLEKSP